MQISQQERLSLYERARVVLGDTEAGVLMELLPPSGWGDVATSASLHATSTELRGEMAEVRGEMAEVKAEIVRLEGRMDLRFAEQTRTIQFWMAGTAISIWLSIVAQSAFG